MQRNNEFPNENINFSKLDAHFDIYELIRRGSCHSYSS